MKTVKKKKLSLKEMITKWNQEKAFGDSVLVVASLPKPKPKPKKGNTITIKEKEPIKK